MKIKIKNTLTFILALTLLCLLSSCGSGKNNPVGKWYNESGRCLDVRDDGSWKLEDSYGTGTWKKLDDGIIEFTDFYGDTQESPINENELGKYIDFGYYGDFYKDSYPSEEEITELKMKNAIELNPFEGVQYEVSGISPYCKISINNQGCSEEVQRYVTYTLDKGTYANNEMAIITATLSTNTGEESYKLTSYETQYSISSQPEYITTAENVDLSILKQELSDTINAEKSKASGGDQLFTLPHWSVGGTHFESCDNIVSSDIYFSSLKEIKYSEFDMQNTPFNQISFTYSVDYTWGNSNYRETGEGTFWVNVSAGNIIKYPDGSIKWGYQSSDAYDFKCSYSQKGLEDCISTTIMANSDSYNISKISQ